jgi:DNA-binding NtrC family response regulator
LVDFDWPGNVRQLENELKRARLLCDEFIDVSDLSPEIRGTSRVPLEEGSAVGLRDALRDYERRLIETALGETGGNVSAAAKLLKIHRVVLHRRMKALDIGRPAPRSEL